MAKRGPPANASFIEEAGNTGQRPTIPQYHFRIRENGALVFRINPSNRHRRIEMQQIAVANTRRGDFKSVRDHVLTDDDKAAIGEWLINRQEHLKERKFRDAEDLLERLSEVAHWAQTEATQTQLDELADRLFFAMHDLRAVLIRKKHRSQKKRDT
ncbi:hypothetical protein [Cognatiyoonia sp. IB215182]|uniref:hypothetical protein n=1 Tax=Cognatiyoonia sp. IB215182 TaxID=3097353 RepID=UPI002A15BD2B|nr:hypothetical protein [Cognatiyoonia sp. IB215182]MDX8355246.1 hypothetical protein [Cognatiyoonia sp. IB215182]